MKNHKENIAAIVAIIIAAVAFFFYIFAPAVVLKDKYVTRGTECIKYFSGLYIMTGKKVNAGVNVSLGEIIIETRPRTAGAAEQDLGYKFYFLDDDEIAELEEGEMRVSRFETEVLENSAIAFLPFAFVVFGVMLCVIVALLESKKAINCGIMGTCLFFLAAIFMLISERLCKPVIVFGYPEFLKSFEESYVLGYGAIVSAILMAVSSVCLLVSAIIKYKKAKKDEKAS